jgi:hypothetical protein
MSSISKTPSGEFRYETLNDPIILGIGTVPEKLTSPRFMAVLLTNLGTMLAVVTLVAINVNVQRKVASLEQHTRFLEGSLKHQIESNKEMIDKLSRHVTDNEEGL